MPDTSVRTPTFDIQPTPRDGGRNSDGVYRTQEGWVWAAIDIAFRPWLEDLGETIAPAAAPGAPLISIGYGPGQRAGSSVRGRCYKAALSGGSNRVFVMPETDDVVQLLATILHELIHVVDDCESGHRRYGKFERLALSLGFQRPITNAANRTDELTRKLRQLATVLGPFAGKVFNPRSGRTENVGGGAVVPAGHGAQQVGSRYFLAVCETDDCPAADDDYKVRMTRLHVNNYGPPVCPACMDPMVFEA